MTPPPRESGGPEQFDRITFDPKVMGGKACIRGMRVTASNIVNMIASGETPERILEAYPYLEADDIKQALQFAAWCDQDL